MKMKFFVDNLKNNKFRINCLNCGKPWLVGDRERTIEEKQKWVCPNCIDEIKANENKVEELEAEGCDEYPLGGMVETYDIEREK